MAPDSKILDFNKNMLETYLPNQIQQLLIAQLNLFFEEHCWRKEIKQDSATQFNLIEKCINQDSFF